MPLELLNSLTVPFSWGRAPTRIIANQQFTQSTIEHPSLKILNWNIAKNNYQVDWLKDLAEIMKGCQPDFLFFQEVRLELTRHRPFILDGMGWHFVPNFLDKLSQHHFGILTASKVQYLKQTAIHTQHGEPIVNIPKATLITEYSLAWSNQTLVTVNIHGINFVSTRKFQSQLARLEAKLSHHQGPLLLSGDFNTWSPSRINCLKAMAIRLNLTTVQFSLDSRRQIKRFLFSDPLDHILYRGLKERPGSADVLTKFESSDHKPMVVEFLIEA
jgi:endonuclease/exonuclease/phosphatase (EEP) superfamily protein YafD